MRRATLLLIMTARCSCWPRAWRWRLFARGGGNNQAYGAAGRDIFEGESGADEVFGDTGQVTVNAGTGEEALSSGSGPDTMNGGGQRARSTAVATTASSTP